MATVQFSKTVPADANARCLVATWALASGDVGQALGLAQFADRTVQVGGTFDGAAVVVEGSIDGVTYFTLTDPQGNAISVTQAALEAVTEAVVFIRPRVSGGTGSTAIAASLLLRG